MKSHSGEQVNLLGSCFPVKGMSYVVPISDYILEICKQTFDKIINDSGHRLYNLVQQRGPSQYALRRAPNVFRFRNARRKAARTVTVLSLNHLLIIYNVSYYSIY